MALTIFIALLAGIASFISPCILPLIPGFMAYLSQTAEKSSRMNTFINSVFFVLGFSSVFAVLGVLLNTALAHSSYAVQVWLSRVAGIIIIFFALHILELIRIPILQSDHKLKAKRFSSSYVTSYVFGASFAVGWTPCVGAILASIFALAISSPASSFVLLLAYAIGLGIPFLIVGIFTEEAMAFIGRSEKALRYFNIVVGILLLALGVLVFTDNLTMIASFIVPKGLLGF
jgi:cytochrome c-type biogenesis protein